MQTDQTIDLTPSPAEWRSMLQALAAQLARSEETIQQTNQLLEQLPELTNLGDLEPYRALITEALEALSAQETERIASIKFVLSPQPEAEHNADPTL